MTNVKNELPVAVHLASGGDARTRTGGTAIDLSGVGTGSFQMQNATRYKLIASTRTAPNVFILIGYSSPVSPSNASCILTDMQRFEDDVPEGTTVYFSVISAMDMQITQGGVNDFIYVSTYG